MRYVCLVPSSHFGGCEAYASRLIDRASERGWDVTVICLQKVCAEIFKSTATIKRVINLNEVQMPFRFRGKSRIDSLLQIFFCFKLLVYGRPEIIHAVLPWHLHSLGFLWAITRLRIPFLFTFQLVAPGYWPNDRQIAVFRSWRKRGFRFCAISENNRRLLCDYFGFLPNEIAVIRNRPMIRPAKLLESSEREKLKCEIGVRPDQILILTVGRFHPQKGHDLIITAIPDIIRAFPAAIFVWAGDGERKSELMALARKKGVIDRVRILGHRKDVPGLLSIADLFLFPSRYEGESFALAEAITAEVPVVASSTSGLSELLGDSQDAYIFGADDVSGMANAVTRALSDPDEARRRAVSANARLSAYTEEDMFRETFALIESVAHKA